MPLRALPPETTFICNRLDRTQQRDKPDGMPRLMMLSLFLAEDSHRKLVPMRGLVVWPINPCFLMARMNRWAS